MPRRTRPTTRLRRVAARHFLRGSVAFLFIALSAPAAAFGRPEVQIVGGDASEVVISDKGDVHHKAADFDFPEQIGDMPLRKIEIYGPGDVSGDYTLRGGGNGDVWITFYVYPAGQPFADEKTGIEESLVDKWSAKPMAAPFPAPSMAADGASGWFEGTFNGLHAANGYILVQRGAWFFEARVTIPDAAGSDGLTRAGHALTSLPWNWHRWPN